MTSTPPVFWYYAPKDSALLAELEAVILAEIERRARWAEPRLGGGAFAVLPIDFLENTNEQGNLLMTQDQLNEIWRRHTAGDEVGRGIVCTTDEEGAEQIATSDDVWRRAQGKKRWTDVPPLKGNLRT